ncbi:hypothetical protein MOSE0_D03752 [Monosporozyma servazzii]
MRRKFKNITSVDVNNATIESQKNGNSNIDNPNNINTRTEFLNVTKVNSIFSQDEVATVSTEINNDINNTHEQTINNKTAYAQMSNSVMDEQYVPKKEGHEASDLFDLTNRSWLELASNYQPINAGQLGDIQPYPTKISDEEFYRIKPYEIDCDMKTNVLNSSNGGSRSTALGKQVNSTLPYNNSKNSSNSDSRNSRNSRNNNTNNNNTHNNNTIELNVNKTKTKHSHSINDDLRITQTQNIEINRHIMKSAGKGEVSKPEKALKVSSKPEKTLKVSSKPEKTLKVSSKPAKISSLIRVWRLNKENRLEKEQQRNRKAALKYRRKKILKELELKNEVKNVALENNSLTEKLRVYENIIRSFIRFIHYLENHNKAYKEDLEGLINGIKSIDKVDIEVSADVDQFLEEHEKYMNPTSK